MQEFNDFLGHFIDDIATDGTHVYWSERDTTKGASRLFRVPVVRATGGPIDLVCGCSTDRLFNADLAGIVRIALDGGILFTPEGLTGNIYRIDLSTGTSTQLVSGLSSGFLNTIPLVVTDNYLYALVNGRDIVRIDKNTGTTTIAATTMLDTAGRDPSDGQIRSDSKGVYWWERAYPDLFLRRLDDQTGLISTLATLQLIDGPPGSTVHDFYSDGSEVWWFNSATRGFVDVQHVSVDGGAASKVTTFSARIGTTDIALVPRSIAGDSTDLYWFGHANVVAKLPKSGGTPSVITWVGGVIKNLVLTDRHLIWTDFPDGIRRMPKSGPTQPDLIWSATFNEMPLDMAVDETDLYWIVENYNPSTTTITTRLLSMPITGNVVRELGTFPGNPVRVFPYGDSVFLAKLTGSGGVISSVPKSGGPERVIVVTDPATPADLHVIDDIIYFSLECFIIQFCSAPTLQAYNLNTAMLTTFLFASFAPNRLYVDESHIYWTQAGGAVQRMSRSGGKVETLTTDYWTWEITGDRGCIYWAAGWEILRQPKPGKQCPTPLTMSVSLLPAGEAGVGYNASLEVSGGSPPYTVSIISGSLPAGLNLDSLNITGTPTLSGKSKFTVQVTDRLETSVSETFSMVVLKALNLTTSSLKAGRIGKKYNAALKATGGKKPYSWSLVSGSLPAGLSLEGSTGKITGTSTASGDFDFTVQVTDPLGGLAQKGLTLAIN